MYDISKVLKNYPELGARVDEFRASRGVDLPRWPNWCFMPMAGWYAIVSEAHGVSRLPLTLAAEVSKVAALGTWRYSKGVYQIDPSLLSALAKSEISGELPSEVLYRLSEWCVYVETPGLEWMGREMVGFWAHLEWDVNTKRSELRFLIDCKHAVTGVPLHIGSWTVKESVDKAIDEAIKVSRKSGVTALFRDGEALADAMVSQVMPLVSLLLYLCSDEPEVEDEKEPGVSPARVAPKKTKKGWRLFPAQKVRTWLVGRKTGEALRENIRAASLADKTIKTHLRRGHWHGYWTGPRNGQQKFSYKWISPLVVKGHRA